MITNSFKALKSYSENHTMVSTQGCSRHAVLQKIGSCRLVVIQGFKRCSFKLRRIAMVPGNNAFMFNAMSHYILNSTK